MAALEGAIKDIHSIDVNRLKLVRDLLWIWIIAHSETEVTLKFWIIKKKFKMKDLHEVFAILLGPKPEGIEHNAIPTRTHS